jgi:hypothetical protein
MSTFKKCSYNYGELSVTYALNRIQECVAAASQVMISSAEQFPESPLETMAGA